MKRLGESVFLALVIVSLSFVLSTIRDQVYAQNPLSGIVQGQTPIIVKEAPGPSGYIVDFAPFTDPNNLTQQLRTITVVDPASKRICVYHEDLLNGTVVLRSVRNIRPDLEIEQYNPTKPTPREVEEWSKKFGK